MNKILKREAIINPFSDEFKLHPQQEDIVLAGQTNDVVIIDSIAGSSKTYTQVVMAHNNKVQSLYLTFSKALAVEASELFPDWVDCRTIHSLAYREAGIPIAHKLSRPRGCYRNVAGTGSEIAKFYKIPDHIIDEDNEIKNTLMGLMVKQTVAKYEASSDLDINKGHLPFSLIKTSKNKLSGFHKKELEKIFNKVGKEVIKYSNKLWKDRCNPNSPVLSSHDTYVKLWALTNPIINTEVLYLDELQDASGVFIGIVQQQLGRCKMVLVGDPDQNLYAWRYSVNGLDMVEGTKVGLSQSFRYGQASADLAMKILDNGREMKGFPEMDTVVGRYDIVDLDKPYVKLFRMNSTLLQEALELLSDGKRVNIHVDVKDYVKMLESAEALYAGSIKKVKHEDILPFDTWEELKAEAKSGGVLSRVFNTIRSGNTGKTIMYLKSHKNVNNPDVTLMSCHRSKGNTFDYVVLADDFESNYDKNGNWVGIDEAERRLLYVGVTRAKFGTQYNNTVQEILERGSSVLEEVTKLDVKGLGHFDKSSTIEDINSFIDKTANSDHLLEVLMDERTEAKYLPTEKDTLRSYLNKSQTELLESVFSSD